MKNSLKIMALFSSIAFFVSVQAVNSILELSQMFQKIRIEEVAKSQAWDKALEATENKIDAMNKERVKTKEWLFFSAIQDLDSVVKQLMVAMTQGKSTYQRTQIRTTIVDKQEKVEALIKKGFGQKESFGQKFKGFFRKKEAKSEQDMMIDLLRGIFDMLKSKIAQLHKENK